jgi:hypothetical protein
MTMALLLEMEAILISLNEDCLGKSSKTAVNGIDRQLKRKLWPP